MQALAFASALMAGQIVGQVQISPEITQVDFLNPTTHELTTLEVRTDRFQAELGDWMAQRD